MQIRQILGIFLVALAFFSAAVWVSEEGLRWSTKSGGAGSSGADKAVTASKPSATKVTGAIADASKAVSAPAPAAASSAASAPLPVAPAAAVSVPDLGIAPPPELANPPNIRTLTRPENLKLVQTLADFCAEAVRVMPLVDLPMCMKTALQPSSGRSVWGHRLFERDVETKPAKLRVLVVGGIHGDELSSSALVLHWIKLAEQTPLNVHWRFVPLINPDGMLNNPPQRTNARGVDLNRNFPTPQWAKEAPLYWHDRVRKDPRRYPGPMPISEPESQWIYQEMERWKPHLVVSVHAPFGVLDFDGPTVPPQQLGRLYLDQVGIYPGSLGNFGGVHKRVPVVTIELPRAGELPKEGEVRQMWLDMLRWMSERLDAS
jgi:murein peptide amidase A